jgi:hypothetical protein
MIALSQIAKNWALITPVSPRKLSVLFVNKTIIFSNIFNKDNKTEGNDWKYNYLQRYGKFSSLNQEVNIFFDNLLDLVNKQAGKIIEKAIFFQLYFVLEQ